LWPITTEGLFRSAGEDETPIGNIEPLEFGTCVEAAMWEPHICDHCKDTENLVTLENGGRIQPLGGGLKTPPTPVYVHESCKDAWARGHGGVAIEAVTMRWPSLEKTIRCAKCGKTFEVVGEQGTEPEVRAETVWCPYDNCGQQVEVMWPKGQPFFVRKIPSEM